MLVRLRRGYGQWLVSGGYLLLVMAGAELDSPAGWRAVAALIAALALAAWTLALRRARAVADTPTSSIASAAQGYVELLGRGRPAGAPLLSPLNQLPCLWYRYQVERRRNDKWVTEESGESTASFLLDDGSGRCLVDPEGAEILPRNSETWHAGDQRFTQALLIEGERIYVLGNFRTRNGDRPGLRAAPDMHLIGRPEDGQDDRLFLISSLPPEKLERRFVFWALAHLAAFFLALGGLAYL